MRLVAFVHGGPVKYKATQKTKRKNAIETERGGYSRKTSPSGGSGHTCYLLLCSTCSLPKFISLPYPLPCHLAPSVGPRRSFAPTKTLPSVVAAPQFSPWLALVCPPPQETYRQPRLPPAARIVQGAICCCWGCWGCRERRRGR